MNHGCLLMSDDHLPLGEGTWMATASDDVVAMAGIANAADVVARAYAHVSSEARRRGRPVDARKVLEVWRDGRELNAVELELVARASTAAKSMRVDISYPNQESTADGVSEV